MFVSWITKNTFIAKSAAEYFPQESSSMSRLTLWRFYWSKKVEKVRMQLIKFAIALLVQNLSLKLVSLGVLLDVVKKFLSILNPNANFTTRNVHQVSQQLAFLDSSDISVAP